MPFVSSCPSYLPVYAEVQEPHAYLQSSQVVVSNLYLGVPTKADITLINGTLLPTRFHWGRVSEPSALEAPGEGDAAPQAPPEQMLSLPSVPRKAGPLEGAAHLVWLFLDSPSGKSSSLPEESQGHTARPPARDWSPQLWEPRWGTVHGLAGACSARQGTGATFLCLRGICSLLPITLAPQGSLCSPGHPGQVHLGGGRRREGTWGSSPPVSTRPSPSCCGPRVCTSSRAAELPVRTPDPSWGSST